MPGSSSAHLIIVPWLFGWDDPVFRSLGFDVALHLGTLMAIIVFFGKDWVRITDAWFKSIVKFKIGDDPDRKMAWYILVACLSGAIMGVLFQDMIENLFHPAGSPIFASSMLVMALIIALLGALLLLADKLASTSGPSKR